MNCITARRLREVLTYDRETGAFEWAVVISKKCRPGRPAGTVIASGYRQIRFEGRDYLAHRLAWLYIKGAWPKELLRARNGNLGDTRWANLEACTRKQIQQSVAHPSPRSRLGVLGVQRVNRKGGEGFTAAITVDRRKHHLGTFETLDAAAIVYWIAKGLLHDAQ